jgi:HlyD family secretion protein
MQVLQACSNLRLRLVSVFLLLLLPGCDPSPEQALGTLEWDRVNNRAPASEVIVEMYVEEGERVSLGEPILALDNSKIEQQVIEYGARLEQAQWQLKELEKGPRTQTILEAEARLTAAQATMENDLEIYRRQQKLYDTEFTSRQQMDITRNNYLNSREKVNELTQKLDELREGTRFEQIEQARASLSAIAAQLERLELLMEEYTIRAQRDGLVESIPFKKGDRPPAQAVVSTVLAGAVPWARIYVPGPYRSKMQPGEVYDLKIDGQAGLVKATLRSISADASFTPYYALTERDRSRLSYIAKLDLTEPGSEKLTAGTPVQLLLNTL